MNRKPRPQNETGKLQQDLAGYLKDWHVRLISRRRFLVGLAGGGIATLFPLGALGADANDAKPATSDPWPIIDMVQQHLFPDEPDAPGARQINALGYLQFVVTDTTLDAGERDFILLGTVWLEDMSQQLEKQAFVDLDEAGREQVLREIAASDAGENWLSTLLLYIFEALLTDPVYGGNTDQLGWRWLQHVPGFPRPPQDKTFEKLLS
ncbi:MAG: gluconate 2-dehydrogenase subunit 3 family protein [Chromatiales bacterium]|jgi:gluconate 2-dehydrogenase gamma chain